MDGRICDHDCKNTEIVAKQRKKILGIVTTAEASACWMWWKSY